MKRLSTFSLETVRTHHAYCTTMVKDRWRKHIPPQTDPKVSEYLKDIYQVVFTRKNTDSVFVASAKKLLEFVKLIEDKYFFRQSTLPEYFKTINKKLEKVFNYDTFSRFPAKADQWFAGRLMTEALKELKYCPYCNADMVYVIKISKNGKIRRSPFDHFYPESRYPFLSLSLYNLIPSCSRCNSSFKQAMFEAQLESFHPYLHDVDEKTHFVLNRLPDEKGSSECEIDDLPIRLMLQGRFSKKKAAFLKNYQSLFRIDEVYSSLYQAKVAQLLRLGVVLNEEYRQDISQLLRTAGIFLDPASVVLGMPLRRQEINMHHIAKLTLDVLEQYCGIKVEK